MCRKWKMVGTPPGVLVGFIICVSISRLGAQYTVGLELGVGNSSTPPPTLERRGVREQLTHSKSPVACVRHSVKCGFCRPEGNTELLSHFTD